MFFFSISLSKKEWKKSKRKGSLSVVSVGKNIAPEKSWEKTCWRKEGKKERRKGHAIFIDGRQRQLVFFFPPPPPGRLLLFTVCHEKNTIVSVRWWRSSDGAERWWWCSVRSWPSTFHLSLSLNPDWISSPDCSCFFFFFFFFLKTVNIPFAFLIVPWRLLRNDLFERCAFFHIRWRWDYHDDGRIFIEC